MLAMGTIASFIVASLPSASGPDYHDAVVAAPVVATIGFGVAIFFFALGLPSIIGGWGLMHYRPWSRVLMIVVSVFHLFHIPLGTALGIYGLFVLLNADAQRILESGGVYSGSAPAYPSSSYGTRPPGAPSV